jgi:CBS domain-containing protein
MAMICPDCGAKNLEGADECANCGANLSGLDQPKPAAQIEQAVMQLPLTALGVQKIHVLAGSSTLDDAVQTLLRQQVDLVAVVDETGKLAGVMSVRDVVTRVGPDYADKLREPVSKFVTPTVETLPSDAPITFAINRMDVGGYRHVPVVEDGRLLGVVSTRDVIRHILRYSRGSVEVTIHPLPTGQEGTTDASGAAVST